MSHALLALLIAGSAQPGGGDWRTVANVGGRIVALDTASVERRGPLAQMQMRVTYDPPRTGRNASALSRAEIDCARSLARIVATTNYHADGTPGDADTDARPFVAIPPGTLFADLHILVCPAAGEQGGAR